MQMTVLLRVRHTELLKNFENGRMPVL